MNYSDKKNRKNGKRYDCKTQEETLMDFVPIVNILFDEDGDGVGSFHDTVYEATGVSHSNEKLKEIFFTLPKDVQMIALQWGLSDTVFGDKAYVFIKEKINGKNQDTANTSSRL